MYFYCSNFEVYTNHTYHPLRHCQRSNGTIIGLRNVKTFEDCVSFGRERSALAFNFRSNDKNNTNRYDSLKPKEESNKTWNYNVETRLKNEDFYNCQLLECPEYGNFTGMINDTRFDYYTLYAKPPPPFSSVCIPQVGMFVLYQKPTNYTFAWKTCREIGGGLAHVVSEKRTNTLANYLKNNLNLTVSKEAYVGLNESIVDKFNTSSNEPLDCFLYRAWAPKHPAKNRRPGCVGLTVDRSWKVFHCAHKMPFLCEIFTTGPNKNVRIDRKCSITRPNNRFIRIKETKNLN
ncbi:uncharacterized protein LOC134828829 [Culicoides brevitarsis]|uniref:uncharacterized protein LOC134828829 n=1 Tax=Culicoides brevitarsis TaxID=469753 RepID=UPI00307B55B1